MLHVRRPFVPALAILSMVTTVLPLAASAEELDPASAPGRARGEVVAADPVVGTGRFHGSSIPARDLPRVQHPVAAPPDPSRAMQPIQDARGLDARGREAARTTDTVRAPAPKTMSGPTTIFDGIENMDQGGGVIPPDENIDVGPNHIVQMVNVSFEVFDKTGTSLMGPSLLSDLWDDPSTPVDSLCDDFNSGDPIVLYDQLADRWFLSQFAWDRDPPVSGAPVDPFWQCIAISKTADPTGAYWLYSFNMSVDVGTGTLLHDYPKFGVWPDGYYMTANQFDMSFGGAFAGVGAFAFDRETMLAGGMAPEVVFFDLGLADFTLAGMLPADLDGPVPPPVGTPNWMVQLDADEFWGLPDGLRVYGVTVDWDVPDDSFVSLNGIIDLSSEGLTFDPVLCVTPPPIALDPDCIPQKDTGVGLDPISDRLMWRLAYRNYGTHEVLIGNHTVDADDDPTAAVQWFEIRDPANPVVRQGGVIDRATAEGAPDGRHRWMGSAAIDGDGNIAVGYSTSKSSEFPAIRISGHSAGPATGVMDEGELTLHAGSGSQTSDTHRWGDYSSLSVDPADDCTFWYTNEYYAATSEMAWKTKIASFSFDGCVGMKTGTVMGTVIDGGASPVEGATVHIGTMTAVTAADGTYTFDAVPADTWDVTVTKGGFAPKVSPGEDVTDGGVTIVDATLDPLVQVRADFDGDGYGDVAIGSPRDVRGGKVAGVVNVLYGSPAGLTSDGSQLLHQGLPGIKESLEDGDRFGSALAVGDFDDDGDSDLAVGAFGEDLGGESNVGIVHVFYGGPAGLDTATPDTFHQNQSGVKDVNEAGDKFAAALAAGDFDGDGDDDLAIGIPGEDNGRGRVLVMEGKTARGVTKDDERWDQDTPGISNRAEPGDRFGEALAAGDVDGDGADDLAVGVPREDLSGVSNGGMVNLIYGSVGPGLTSVGSQQWSQDSSGVRNVVEANDRFGAPLAIGDYDADGFGDLTVGVPRERSKGIDRSGAVNVLYGSGSGPSSVGDQIFHRAIDGISGGLGGNDRFGDSLAVTDVNGDGADDLAVGASRDTYLGRSNAGSFNVILGSAGGGLGADDGRVWTQQLVGGSFAEAGDRFAEALTGADVNGDGIGDLLVGVPREDTAPLVDWGLVHELRGAPGGLTSLSGGFWHQDVAGVPSNARDDERFGSALAG